MVIKAPCLLNNLSSLNDNLEHAYVATNSSEVGSRDDGVEGEKKKYMGRGRVCGDPRQPGVKREIKGGFDNSRGDGMGDKVERICDKSAGGEEKVRQRSAMTPMKLAGEEMSDMKGTRGQKLVNDWRVT